MEHWPLPIRRGKAKGLAENQRNNTPQEFIIELSPHLLFSDEEMIEKKIEEFDPHRGVLLWICDVNIPGMQLTRLHPRSRAEARRGVSRFGASICFLLVRMFKKGFQNGTKLEMCHVWVPFWTSNFLPFIEDVQKRVPKRVRTHEWT